MFPSHDTSTSALNVAVPVPLTVKTSERPAPAQLPVANSSPFLTSVSSAPAGAANALTEVEELDLSSPVAVSADADEDPAAVKPPPSTSNPPVTCSLPGAAVKMPSRNSSITAESSSSTSTLSGFSSVGT